MGNILLPKIENIDLNLCNNILKKVDRIIRSNEDIEKALDLVDREVLVNFLKINSDICNRFRLIWKNAEAEIKTKLTFLKL